MLLCLLTPVPPCLRQVHLQVGSLEIKSSFCDENKIRRSSIQAYSAVVLRLNSEVQRTENIDKPINYQEMITYPIEVYSYFNDSTGLADAAFTTWKLMVARPMIKAANPEITTEYQ